MRCALLVGLLCAGCAGGSRETVLIEAFFAAARLQDTAALSSVAQVTFDPRAEGTVQRFDISRVETPAPGQERVVVDAQVRTPDGGLQRRALEFWLQRQPDGRWMITRLQPRASHTSRGASSAPPS